MGNKFNKLFFFSAFIGALVLIRCANPVAPTGGPKDIKPPVVLECEPPNQSTLFSSKKIRIEFNKFIQLKDPLTNVSISPPLLPNTDFSIRGKSIQIKLNDSLRKDKTYSFFFGESISDLTENNILHDFYYVFSTGAWIDSLKMQGTIKDAFTQVPLKDVFAMLYIDENDTIPFDSLPFKVRSYYIAKTNDKGEFTFNNLRNEHYKLFALKDMNGDYIYNLPGEKIGFLDTLAVAGYHTSVISDSLTASLPGKKDSIPQKKSDIPSYSLQLFQEVDSVQKLLKYDLPQDNEVRLVFRFPAVHPEFVPLNFSEQGRWALQQFTPKRDTVILWLMNVPVDSLILKVSDKGAKTDTVTIDLTTARPKKKPGKKESSKTPVLAGTLNFPGGSLNQFRNDMNIAFSYPISHQDLSRLLLIDEKDTLHPGCEFIDSLHRILRVNHKWKEDHAYKVLIPDSTFFGINSLTNDTMNFAFRTKAIKELGMLRIDITLNENPGNYIIQLLDGKENVLEERKLSSSTKEEFNYLMPGTYKIKAILDQNNNGRWDTGNYLKHLQPEQVYYFPKAIEVRGNWDIDEAWPL